MHGKEAVHGCLFAFADFAMFLNWGKIGILFLLFCFLKLLLVGVIYGTKRAALTEKIAELCGSECKPKRFVYFEKEGMIFYFGWVAQRSNFNP
jgi:hypothetical protein